MLQLKTMAKDWLKTYPTVEAKDQAIKDLLEVQMTIIKSMSDAEKANLAKDIMRTV